MKEMCSQSYLCPSSAREECVAKQRIGLCPPCFRFVSHMFQRDAWARGHWGNTNPLIAN